MNEPGSLAQIAQVIAEHDGNIDNIRMSRQSPDFTSLTIDLESMTSSTSPRSSRNCGRRRWWRRRSGSTDNSACAINMPA